MSVLLLLSLMIFADDLNAMACTRVKELHRTWGHVRPDGREWWTAITDMEYRPGVYREIAARNGVGLSREEAIAAWMVSADHDDALVVQAESIGYCANGTHIAVIIREEIP